MTSHEMKSSMAAFEDHIRVCEHSASQGDFDEVMRHARALLQLSADHAAGWFYLGVALNGIGNNSAALIAMSKATKCGLSIPEIDHPDLFLLALEAAGEETPRLAELMKPCPIFGRLGSTLSKVTETTIENILDARLSAWHNGDIPMPRLLPASDSPAVKSGPIRLLLVQTEFIAKNPENVRNDITEALAFSARLQNFEVRRSLASERIVPPTDANNLKAGLVALQAEIREMRPDLVLLEGNAIGDPNEYTLFFADRAAQGFKLAVLIPDLHDLKPNKFDYWARAADLVIHFNERTTHRATSAHREKGLYWPALPFPPEMFAPDRDKIHDLCIVGSLNRGRELFSSLMRVLKFPGFYVVHDRSQAQALSADDYKRILGSSKMVLNNGTLTANTRVVTGRVFEAIWSRSLLLEESGADTSELLVPFIHYVPFANVHQFVSYAQFFAKHEDRRLQIVRAAYDWATTHFLPSRFWAAVRHKLAI